LIGILAVFIFIKYKTNSIDVVQNSVETKTKWIALPAMPKGRAVGGVINFENKIYYFGGVGAYISLTVYDNFVYDIKTKQWTKLNNIKCARCEMGIVELNGKAYLFGGWLGNAPTDTAEVYDIKTKKYELLPPLPKKITSCSATASNGKIYIIGGTLNVTNTYFFEFDPITKTYQQLATFEKSRMNCNLVSKDSLIYAIGGGSYKNDNYFLHNDCEVYNIKTKIWEAKTSMPVAIMRGTACIIKNKIHFLGGTTSVYPEDVDKYTNAHYIYDIETDVWSNGEALPYKVCSSECTVIVDKIYLIGGFEKKPNASSKVWVLN
jgi:N-acetylneuraminic acid mutarotase